MKVKRLIIIVVISVIVLLVPLVAMQFTNKVNWTLFDFLIAGVLLFGTGMACELVLMKLKKRKYRIAIVITFVVIFLLLWAELAVGIFGTPLAGS